MVTRYYKKIKIGKLNIIIETFRIQNKFLPLLHNLFKTGFHTYIDKENNKYYSFVISNFRIMIVKSNGKF